MLILSGIPVLIGGNKSNNNLLLFSFTFGYCTINLIYKLPYSFDCGIGKPRFSIFWIVFLNIFGFALIDIFLLLK